MVLDRTFAVLAAAVGFLIAADFDAADFDAADFIAADFIAADFDAACDLAVFEAGAWDFAPDWAFVAAADLFADAGWDRAVAAFARLPVRDEAADVRGDGVLADDEREDDVREDDASPVPPRCLFTVRAGIFSARPAERPRSISLSLTCSY
ncbi:hypothetical protein GCM10010399_47050 [Dactylosporangium fulvum]